MRHAKSKGDGKPKKRHRRIERGATSREGWELMKRMYDYTCPCCGRREPEIKLTKDHIVAVCDGGSSYIENLQPLCTHCNAEKGTRYEYYPPPIIMEVRREYA